MRLRLKLPDMERGFRVPLFPIIPILGIVINALLAIYLFTFSPLAWYVAAAWIVVGLLAYYTYFSRIEEIEKPKEILLEEVLVSRQYSVLIPVATQDQARILGRIGSILARANDGEILALNVVRVPYQLTLGDGRSQLKHGRPYLETVIEQAKKKDVPVHTMIRLGRDVADAVRKTAIENASDLILLGWPGYTNTAGRLYGSVIDPIVDDPPCDIALVRYREQRPIRSIFVPVSGGPNSRRVVRTAVQMASMGEEGPAQVNLMHIVPPGAGTREKIRTNQIFDYAMEGIDYPHIERNIVEGTSVLDSILESAENCECDLIVIGSADEPLFRNLLVGSVADQVANRAKVTVIVVKRRQSAFHSFLRQTVLEPTTNPNNHD
jgi:nucleotide-binding universal stress UspA family protein